MLRRSSTCFRVVTEISGQRQQHPLSSSFSKPAAAASSSATAAHHHDHHQYYFPLQSNTAHPHHAPYPQQQQQQQFHASAPPNPNQQYHHSAAPAAQFDEGAVVNSGVRQQMLGGSPSSVKVFTFYHLSYGWWLIAFIMLLPDLMTTFIAESHRFVLLGVAKQVREEQEKQQAAEDKKKKK